MDVPAATGITGFQFITSVSTIQRDDETRKRVRSHARRQKLPHEPIAKQPLQKRASQKERVSKFRLSNRPSAPNNKQTPPALPSPHSGSSPAQQSPVVPSASDAPATDAHVHDSLPERHDCSVENIKVERKSSGWHSEVITDELAFTVAAELPSFSVLPIRTTPLTEKLFKWMMCICLSPQKKFVQRWFNKCGVPVYFNTYYSSFLALSHSMNPQGNWFNFIAVDPAMTHGFMGLVAAMHCALTEWNDMTTVDFHRYEAIKYVNKRLNLEGKNDATVSDGVIVAVSLLVHVEAFIGSLQAARAHLMGLRRMVEMRGGLFDGFGHRCLLQRTLAWADFAYATASQTALSFPFVPSLASTLGIHNRFLSRSMILNAMAKSRGSNELTVQNRETMELFELLWSTTEAVNAFEFDKLESLQSERGQMSDSVYLVEYRLCSLEEVIRSKSSNSFTLLSSETADGQHMVNYSSPVDLSDALVYASHLYLHMTLRGQPPQARGHRLLVEALMASLYGTIMSLNLFTDTWPTTSADLVWPLDLTVSSDPTAEGWHGPSREFIDSSDSTPDSSKEGMKDELHEDILLWILFVGSCAQVPSYSWDGSEALIDCRGFFLSSLRRYCLTRGILNKEVLTTKLRDIIWLKSWCEKQLEMIWARIGTELGI